MNDEVWLGRVVFYQVSETDSGYLKYNRATVLPAVVVRVWTKDCVNLQIFVDGPSGTEWVTSVMKGTEPGQWRLYLDEEGGVKERE
jgi:hypothetical protein